MLDLLTLTRQRLGDPPRRVPRRHVRPAPPWAVPPGQDARSIGEQLFREGHLVRAIAARASTSLFREGGADGFAIVAHPMPGTAVSAEQLAAIATAVGELGSQGLEDPALATVGEAVRSLRTLGKLPVPAAIARDARVFLSTVLVRPHDLPGRRMGSWFLPVLVHEALYAVIVPPKELWAPDLVSAWADLAAEKLDQPP